ncbi:MAG: TA system VapC family ribonuclease toxin [Chloroflexota bacterium]
MPDVDVLVYAHRVEDPRHSEYAAWLKRVIDGPEPFALSVLVAVGFVRVVTMPAGGGSTPVSIALAFVDELVGQPGCRTIIPGPGHLGEVARLCRAVGATGNMVADAQHAALAIAEGCTWVTADRDFARFAAHGLSWQHLSL